jgi:hypothetical protein
MDLVKKAEENFKSPNMSGEELYLHCYGKKYVFFTWKRIFFMVFVRIFMIYLFYKFFK